MQAAGSSFDRCCYSFTMGVEGIAVGGGAAASKSSNKSSSS